MHVSARPADRRRSNRGRPGNGSLRAEGGVRIGLTPVLLDSDMLLLRALDGYFRDRLQRPVELVRRRTYQEISMMLLSGQLDAAWICGFPYVQYRDRLALLAVPVYLGKPLYQSYVIVNGQSTAQRFDDLRGQVHLMAEAIVDRDHRPSIAREIA